ncbi:MAG: molybdate ABC transporter substrate-binding protein [Rhodospirillaceae bacterium]|nr:molybdate ABC transporter substrate-binding protein [Rhodospirillaceae bacterium]
MTAFLFRRAAAAAFFTLAILAGSAAARADDVLVAVAANFADAAQDLAALYEKSSGNKVAITTGSTGKLYAQIKAGAPFQILLSADAKTPAKLEDEQAAIAGTRFTYAIGKLALWSMDAQRIGADGAAALQADDFQHLAIANPELAPYGIAARETLQSLGLWDKLSPRIVMGENIGQTHSMVATGNAELGFVALSAVLNPKKPSGGSHWAVPQEMFKPIRQDAVLLNAGKDNQAAAAFLDFMKSPDAHALIESYGYGVE